MLKSLCAGSPLLGEKLDEIMIALQHLKFKALSNQYVLQRSIMGNLIDVERLGILEGKRREE